MKDALDYRETEPTFTRAGRRDRCAEGSRAAPASGRAPRDRATDPRSRGPASGRSGGRRRRRAPTGRYSRRERREHRVRAFPRRVRGRTAGTRGSGSRPVRARGAPGDPGRAGRASARRATPGPRRAGYRSGICRGVAGAARTIGHIRAVSPSGWLTEYRAFFARRRGHRPPVSTVSWYASVVAARRDSAVSAAPERIQADRWHAEIGNDRSPSVDLSEDRRRCEARCSAIYEMPSSHSLMERLVTV
jgi:hypothetical protein